MIYILIILKPKYYSVVCNVQGNKTLRENISDTWDIISLTLVFHGLTSLQIINHLLNE